MSSRIIADDQVVAESPGEPSTQDDVATIVKWLQAEAQALLAAAARAAKHNPSATQSVTGPAKQAAELLDLSSRLAVYDRHALWTGPRPGNGSGA